MKLTQKALQMGVYTLLFKRENVPQRVSFGEQMLHKGCLFERKKTHRDEGFYTSGLALYGSAPSGCSYFRAGSLHIIHGEAGKLNMLLVIVCITRHSVIRYMSWTAAKLCISTASKRTVGNLIECTSCSWGGGGAI